MLKEAVGSRGSGIPECAAMLKGSTAVLKEAVGSRGSGIPECAAMLKEAGAYYCLFKHSATGLRLYHCHANAYLMKMPI